MGNLLTLTTFIPLLGAAILALFLRGSDEAAQRNAKWVALATTLATFLVSLFILFGFNSADPGFQMVEEADWLLGLKYKMGVDGISILFVMLTTFLMPIVIASCWEVNSRVKEYMIAFLVLETLMLGVFMALDLVLFYPDVLDHRYLGRKEPDLRELQVLPLYLPWIGFDAGGHGGDVR